MDRSGRFARLAGITDRLLPFWFLLWSGWRLWDLGFVQLGLGELSWLGRDFRIYRNAALALVNGTDPWLAFDHWNGTDWHFAALPLTAQLFVPFAWLPEGIGLAIFLAATVAVVLLAFRRIGLPPWFLLFPPLMEGLAAANPQVLLLGLLLVGGPAARALAAGLKVYALIPIVARREWRAVAAVATLVVASFAVAPGLWIGYAGQFGAISARLAEESHGGVSATIVLDPVVFGPAIANLGTLSVVPGLLLYGLVAGLVLLVAVRDTRAAGWLFVPLLWPSAEYHYATFALPVARRLSIWVIAIATVPTYLLGLILLAYEVAAARRAMVAEPAPVSLATWFRSLWPGRVAATPQPVGTPPLPGS